MTSSASSTDREPPRLLTRDLSVEVLNGRATRISAADLANTDPAAAQPQTAGSPEPVPSFSRPANVPPALVHQPGQGWFADEVVRNWCATTRQTWGRACRATTEAEALNESPAPFESHGSTYRRVSPPSDTSVKVVLLSDDRI